jgi:hypothetical protein
VLGLAKRAFTPAYYLSNNACISGRLLALMAGVVVCRDAMHLSQPLQRCESTSPDLFDIVGKSPIMAFTEILAR